MFRTTKCTSSGRHVHAVLWYFFMHPYTQSGRYQDVFDSIKSLMKKAFIFLVLITYVNHNARFKKHKV